MIAITLAHVEASGGGSADDGGSSGGNSAGGNATGGVTSACNPACSGAKPICNNASKTCVECTTDGNCAGAEPACNSTTNTCVECTKDANCSGPTPACEAARIRVFSATRTGTVRGIRLFATPLRTPAFNAELRRIALQRRLPPALRAPVLVAVQMPIVRILPAIPSASYRQQVSTPVQTRALAFNAPALSARALITEPTLQPRDHGLPSRSPWPAPLYYAGTKYSACGQSATTHRLFVTA